MVPAALFWPRNMSSFSGRIQQVFLQIRSIVQAGHRVACAMGLCNCGGLLHLEIGHPFETP
jgi:hypothetical protein